MIRVLKPRHAGLWLLAASISACAAAGPAGAPGDRPIAPTHGYTTLQAGSPDPAAQGVAGAFPFLAAVGLTAAQTTQIEAILTRQPAAEAGGAPAATNAQAILTAPTINPAALRALLTAAETRHRAGVRQGVATLAAVRATLTVSQRLAASAAVLQVRSAEATPAPQPEPSSDLTAAQQALFRAAEPPTLPPGAVAKALSAFLKTGDTAAYMAATGPTRSVSAQVNATVAALTSLTLAQRRAMFQQPTEQE
ncbi:MAG: hypothetical protein ACK46X_12025 [Candidatus Sericytochromatia bacterium]